MTKGKVGITSDGDSKSSHWVRSVAASLLLLVAAVAPWLAGANSSIPGTMWGLCCLLAAPFLLIAIQRLSESSSPPVPALATGTSAVLLLSLLWWAVRSEPEFATPFAAENWGWVLQKYPAGVMQPPHLKRLGFLFCLLLSFLATIDLASSRAFRRRLCWTMGLNGLALGSYAIGMRGLDWSTLPWLQIEGGMEQFNVAFFHHCGASACFNTGCLMLIFQWATTASSRPMTVAKFLCALLIVAVGVVALPLWHSESAMVIAAGTLAAGLSWVILEKLVRPSPALLRGALALLFAALFTWQVQQIRQLHHRHPDGWQSAEATRFSAPDRDARVREMANRRGDRLVVSDAPARPVAWTAAARMAADHPLLGPGPGSWIKLIPLYSNEPIIQTFFQHRQFAHHDLLQTAAEWGVLPALLFLSLWVGGLTHASSSVENYLNANLSIVVGLVTLALHSLLHFPLQIPALQIWAALLLGSAWATAENQSSAPP